MLPLADINGPSLGVFLHILSAVVTFGVFFTYPVADWVVSKHGDERHLPFWHRVQGAIGLYVVAPGGAVVLLTGLYLVFRPNGIYDLGDPFVGTGLLAILVIEGVGGAFFKPKGERLMALAERDVAASQGGVVTLSAEYTKLRATVRRVSWLMLALIVVVLFLMVVKPGS